MNAGRKREDRQSITWVWLFQPIRRFGPKLGVITLSLFVLAARTFGASPEKATMLPPQVDKINAVMAQSWQDFGLKPAAIEDDLKWCRRIFLDVLGRIPSYAELKEFGQDRSNEKRLNLVNRLLNEERYLNDYAGNWSVIWTNILIGRVGGTENRTLISRAGMEKYLRDCFANNAPYDRMVKDLVTATGTTKPGTENFNGASNFLVMKVNEENGVQATAAVSRIFLGLQVQCTQCHNHPFNEWKQQKFWELNAFFRQTRALRRFEDGTNDVDFAELIDQDFAGESRDPEAADVFYQLRTGATKVAFPVFIDGREIPKSGYVAEVNRRSELATMILESPYLDKMIVNRMWAHFMAFGFTRPIDDLGPHNPASNPELLEELGKEFRKSSYNLKELIRWIVLSKPYQLTSKITTDNQSDDPTVGEPPRFSHFYSRQMRAEELYQSLIVATQADRQGTLQEQEKRRNEWLKQFVIAFGTDDGGETSTFNGSIPQSLMMFNGDLMREATSLKPGSWLDRIAQDKSTIKEKVQRLYLAGLARLPRKEELAIVQAIYEGRKRDTGAMLQDVWWAILNSNEFIINH